MSQIRADSYFKLAQLLDIASDLMLWDDRKDWGYFSYYNREKGDPKIGYGKGYHPSPFHHWQVGLILKAVSEVLGYASIYEAMKNDDELEYIRATINKAKSLI
ncbi:MAG: hypothetical protein QXO37_02495 [Candidatus Nitrosocaldaceae archaeon]